MKRLAGALLACLLPMAPAAALAQTGREAILTWEDYDLTVEQACAVDDVAAWVLEGGKVVWCVDDGDVGAAVAACGDDETLELLAFHSNHAVFFVDGVGLVPCEEVSALEEAPAAEAPIAAVLRSILKELEWQTCIQLAACGEDCKGMAFPADRCLPRP